MQTIHEVREDLEAADRSWKDARFGVRFTYGAELFVIALLLIAVWFLGPNLVGGLMFSVALYVCRKDGIAAERAAFNRARACALAMHEAEREADRLARMQRRAPSGLHARGIVSRAWN